MSCKWYPCTTVVLILLLSVCPAISAQSVNPADGLGSLEPRFEDAVSSRVDRLDRANLRSLTPGLSPSPLQVSPELTAVHVLQEAGDQGSARHFLSRVLVSGAVGGLAGYLLGGWIEGMGDCVGLDERSCRDPGADQRGFVIGMSVGVLVSGILHFW